MHRRSIAFALAAALLVAAPFAFAQDDAPPPADPAEPAEPAPGETPPAEELPEMVQITPKQGGLELVELFQMISVYTGESIVFKADDPQIKGRRIEFVGAQTVPREDLFSWFQSLLAFQRIVLLPVGPEGYEQWMALDLNDTQIQNRPIWVRETELEEWADRDGVYIVSTITVKNLTDTSRARNALAQFSTRPNGKINDVPGTLAFVVGDYAPVVVAMYRLLQAMDVAPEEYVPVAETYLLKNAVAVEIQPILADLIAQDQQAISRRQAQNQGAPEKPDPRILADTRQDAIIVYAVPEDQARIAELIGLLDREVHYKRGNIHFRPIRHTDAKELADLLNEVVQGTGVATSTGPRRPTPGPGPTPTAGTITGGQTEPVIVADQRTNSLLIQATATQMIDLDSIIVKMDVPRDQVLVEAALIELAIDDIFRFGVEVATPVTQDDDLNSFAAFLKSTFGLSELLDTNDDGIPDTNVPLLGQTGFTTGFFKRGIFPLVVQALQSNTKARALSLPSVVVEDGSRAIMTVEDQVPFPVTEETQTGISRTNVDFTDAVITLDISPHISSDNYLRLHIKQTVQSFRGQTDPSLPPPRTGREIETDIVIPDGYTVVMGGLINENEQKTDDGIPILRDIPILGHLFGNRRDTNASTSLFLFVTPTILKNGLNNTFDDYHRVTWQRKMLADQLLNEAIHIHNTRFKVSDREGDEPPAAKSAPTLDRIEDSGFLDQPRMTDAAPAAPTPAEAKERYERLIRERELKESGR